MSSSDESSSRPRIALLLSWMTTLDTYTHMFEAARHGAGRPYRAREERLRQPARPHVRTAGTQTESDRSKRRRGYAGTSSRTGLSAGPCSKPITKRISSASASRCSVCTEVLCWPLSIREIAE
jgi:hypothetical protein